MMLLNGDLQLDLILDGIGGLSGSNELSYIST